MFICLFQISYRFFTIRMCELLSSFLVKEQENVSVSFLSVMGKFMCEEKDESLEIAFRKEEMTLVGRMDQERKIEVSRVALTSYSRTVSVGECVEEGFFLNEEVYKKFTTRGGPGENTIEVEEFRIEKPWLRPDHGAKLVGVLILKFINVKGIEKLQVNNS